MENQKPVTGCCYLRHCPGYWYFAELQIVECGK